MARAPPSPGSGDVLRGPRAAGLRGTGRVLRACRPRRHVGSAGGAPAGRLGSPRSRP